MKHRLEEATVTMQRLASCEADLQKYQSLDLDPEHVKSVEEELHCKCWSDCIFSILKLRSYY